MKNFMLSISLFITTGGLIYGQSYNLNHLNNFNSNEPLYKIAVEAEQAFDTIGRGKGTGYKQFRPWLYLSELNQSSSFSKLNLSTLERNKPLGIKQSCQWTNLGPFSDVNAANNQEANIGRIMSLTIANDHKTFFMASDGGGLWKSENAGISWIDYGDKLPTMDLSYNAIAPSDNQVLYVMDNNTIQYENNQIFKSTDGGKSFTTVNNNTVSQGRKIIINPNKD